MPDLLRQLGLRGGLPGSLPADPFPLLASWYEGAAADSRFLHPNAMVLATCAADGRPSARVVLCKAIETTSGSVVFYTSYVSRKAAQIEANPCGACVFHWEHLGRQARLEGRVERVSPAESDEYFASRPLLSRLGAWASRQSQPMNRRSELIRAVLRTMAEFRVPPLALVRPGQDVSIPRPNHWGGYRLRANRVELWAGAVGRLHDRAIWTRDEATGEVSEPEPRWTVSRAYP